MVRESGQTVGLICKFTGLESHQGQQRADNEGDPGPSLAEQLRREKIDEALAPAGSLDKELPSPFQDQLHNRFELIVSEGRRWSVHFYKKLCRPGPQARDL